MKMLSPLSAPEFTTTTIKTVDGTGISFPDGVLLNGKFKADLQKLILETLIGIESKSPADLAEMLTSPDKTTRELGTLYKLCQDQILNKSI